MLGHWKGASAAVVLSWGLVFACEEESTELEPAPNGSVSANDDAAALATCDAPVPCARGGAQKIDNAAYSLGTGTSCVLEALAERRPGRYQYNTDNRYASGGVDIDYTILITAGGSVQYTRTVREDDFQYAPSSTLTPEPAQRCTLKPASYFEACLEAIETRPQPSIGQFPEPFWTCVFGDGDARQLEWFESCERDSAACDGAGYRPAENAGAGADAGGDSGAEPGANAGDDAGANAGDDADMDAGSGDAG